MTQLGTYRRAVSLRVSSEFAIGQMEDDAHHFRVTIGHDGHRILNVQGEPIRTPWTICPGAVGVIQRLVGRPLDADIKSLMQDISVTEQCTHMYDLAVLLMRHIVVGIPERIYRVTFPIDRIDEVREAVLERDGKIVLRWLVSDQSILGPEPFSGLALRKANAWARSVFENADDLEAVAVLQRAVFSSVARSMDLDGLTNPTTLEGRLGPCYVFRPGYIDQARRNVGSTIDFTTGRRPLSEVGTSLPDTEKGDV